MPALVTKGDLLTNGYIYILDFNICLGLQIPNIIANFDGKEITIVMV